MGIDTGAVRKGTGLLMKETKKERNRKYYQENKEQILAQKKKYKEENKVQIAAWKKDYYQENKEEILEKNRHCYQENKEQRRAQKKEYYQKNKEQILIKKKKYRDENKEDILERQRKDRKENKDRYRRYNAKRYQSYRTDPCYKLRTNVRNAVNQRLKNGKGGESILPYVDWNSYEELKEHLESQFEDWMTWENHGKWHPTEKRWHIDHIKPQSVLLEGVTSMDDPKFRECWALENLRPLEARENISKGNKIL